MPAKLSESTTLVRHLETLTSHRDAALLNVSVMSSLRDLLNLERIGLYAIFQREGQLFVALSSWDDGGSIQCADGAPPEEKIESITLHPELAQCLVSEVSSCLVHDGKHGLYVPVLIEQQPVAIFAMCRERVFSKDELSMANGIVGVYRNYLSLLEDSQHDSLTGLLNRKTFDHGLAALLASFEKRAVDRLNNETERRSKLAEGHWLAVIDIDHFKRINDQYGHLYGDEVLILMAHLMRKEFRQRDRIYRFGGEEFVVLMRNIDVDGALRKLERLRKTVEAHTFPQIGQVTVTIGYDRVSAAATSALVLGQADEALYYGKAHGRNQVNCYNTLLEQGKILPKRVHTEVELF